MFIYHCFILLTIIIVTKQIELSLSLDLLSSSLTPISYIRSGDNSIVLSHDDSSLIYNLETGAKDNYDSSLSSLIKDIRGSHYPAFYYSSDTEYDMIYMSKDQHYILCNGHYSL